MDKKLRIPIIVVLAVLLIFLMPISARPENVLMVDRTIIPENGGLVYVVDKIHGADDSFRFGIVEEMHNRLVQLVVNGGESKFIEKSPSGLYIYEINPKSTDLIITAIYRELIYDAGGNNYELVINAEPLIQGQTVHANILFSSTSYVRYPGAPSDWTLTNRGLEKNNITISGDTIPDPIRIRLISSGISLIHVESLDMTYEPSESIIVITMRIKNQANSLLRQLDLNFPNGIEVKEVRDTLGKLSYSWSKEKNILTVNLEQSRYALQNSWRYTFTILAKCQTPETMYINDDEVKILLFTPINATVGSLSISVILPAGYEVDMTNANVAEYHHDEAGAAIARIESRELNIYQNNYITLPLVKSSSSASLASWIIGGGFVVIILSAIVLQVIRGKFPRTKIISQKDLQTISKAIQELQKLRSILLEIENGLSPTAVKTRPQVMTDKVHVVRRIADEVINSIEKLEEKTIEIQETTKEINSSLGVLSEALRVILRNYTDFQKGELSQQSYKKIYDSFRKDLRYAYDKLLSIEDTLRELCQK
ncbi:MAG: hypothetical protein QW789_00090 [Nitrososphaerota archaeon]